MNPSIGTDLVTGNHAIKHMQNPDAFKDIEAQLHHAQDSLTRERSVRMEVEKELIRAQGRLELAERHGQRVQSKLASLQRTRFWQTYERLRRLKGRLRKVKSVLLHPTTAKTVLQARRDRGVTAERPSVHRPRRRPGRTILVIDAYVPLYDQDAGSLRMFHLIKMMLDLGYSPIFLPHEGHKRQPYAAELEALGVEVLCNTDGEDTLIEQVWALLPEIDIAWVSRPEHYQIYTKFLWHNPAIKVIYDTVDLHFLRMKRQWEMSTEHSEAARSAWEEMQALETRAAQLADVTVVVTDVEKKILHDFGAENVCVIPTIHPLHTDNLKSFDERDGLLFIGGPHTPNIDAVQWLCREIMPLVWRAHPDIHLTLLGSNPVPEVKALANERVTVPGFIKDVDPYFINSRVFVAPLRFGAGMKGKVGQSLSFGLPAVLTPIGAEGIGLTDGVDALIADTAEAFAAAILRLYHDPLLWNRLSENSLDAMRQYGVEAVQQELDALLAPLTRAEL